MKTQWTYKFNVGNTIFSLKTSGIMFMAPFIPTVSRICCYKNDGRVTSYMEISQLNNQKKDNSLTLSQAAQGLVKVMDQLFTPDVWPMGHSRTTWAVKKRFPKRKGIRICYICKARPEKKIHRSQNRGEKNSKD